MKLFELIPGSAFIIEGTPTVYLLDHFDTLLAHCYEYVTSPTTEMLFHSLLPSSKKVIPVSHCENYLRALKD